jgi:hypothetical protein
VEINEVALEKSMPEGLSIYDPNMIDILTSMDFNGRDYEPSNKDLTAPRLSPYNDYESG